MTAAELPEWVAAHCDGVPPTDSQALTWMRNRPTELRELMVMFPPSCVLRGPDGRVWVLASWWSRSDGSGCGVGLRTHDSGQRHACHAEHLEVVRYWQGCTPAWVAQVLGKQLTRREAILAALAQGESYGLEIRKRTDELGVRLTDRSLFQALHELVSEGRLNRRAGEPRKERGGRPRYYYSLVGKHDGAQ